MHSYRSIEFGHNSEKQLTAVAICNQQAKQKKLGEEESRGCLLSKNARSHIDVKSTHSFTNLRSTEYKTHPNGLTERKSSQDLDSSRHQEVFACIDEVGSESDNEITETKGLPQTFQLAPALNKRLQDLHGAVARMSSVLLSPDRHELGEEDADRAIKRSVEFDAMFARNHLYEIERTRKEANQLIARSANPAELESRTSAALKCVTQALQVYTNYVGKGSRAKFQQLVPIFQTVSSVHGLLEKLSGQRDFPLRKDVEVSCSYLKKILLEMSATESGSVARSGRELARANLPKPSSDLSMYSRQRNEWRKKPASSTRAKNEPSDCKPHQIQSKAKETTVEVTEATADCLASPTSKSENADKELQCKGSNVKEASFRNATRAVSEEQVKTMMETIPIEPLEEGKLCLDDRTFQTLKFLNESCKPLQNNNSMVNNQHVAVEHRLRTGSDKQDGNESCKVLGKNFKLVCMKEGDKTSETFTSNEEVSKPLKLYDEPVLSLDQINEGDLKMHKQQATQFNTQCPQYKDGRALTTVERLANNILMDMIIQQQKGESDEIVEMLYNLKIK